MKILVALDNTPSSEAALLVVAQHKWPEGSQVKLLNVIDRSRSKKVIEKLTKKQSPLLNRQNTKQLLDEIVSNLKARIPELPISGEVVEGDPKSDIVKVARQWKSDLIVIGSTSKKSIDKLVLGSVSQAVLQKADCPTLIVRLGRMSGHIQRGEDFTRIVVASDGRNSSKAAFAWLASQSWPKELVYKVMSVIPEEEKNKNADAQKAAWMMRHWSYLKERVEDGLRKDAEKLGKGLDNEYISVDVVPGNPKDKVVEIAKNWRAELIVTGAQSKSHLDKIFQGSVSQAIAVKAASCVLVIKGLDKHGMRLSDKASQYDSNDKNYLPEPETTKQSTVDNAPPGDSDAPFKMF